MHGKARAIMFQGTGSGVGKSLVCAAFCRVLAKSGVKVAPFKAQNMALNSFVTMEGGEMGRAQAFQAEACGILPDVSMNPILLKPTGEARSQVILRGVPSETIPGREYYARFEAHSAVVREAYESLSADYDVIVIEGAGSPAEINLQTTDLVNMFVAEMAHAPVVLVGDIDRGGVFAWIKGTYDLVPDRHRKRFAGYLVNRFRGDVSLLAPGIRQFADIIPDLPCLGVLPWIPDARFDEEDGVFVKNLETEKANGIRIAVIHLPRISNFTDFAPLAVEPDVSLALPSSPSDLGPCDCLVLPGTKTTLSDLAFLKASGWDRVICDLAQEGTPILGICGGYQMLGTRILDPHGHDGHEGMCQGLGLLSVETVMTNEKRLVQTAITFHAPPFFPTTVPVRGYEIHMGRTTATGPFRPLGPDHGTHIGAAHPSLPVIGTYIHGLFDNDALRRAFLDFLRTRKGLEPLRTTTCWRALREARFDLLARWLESHADLPRLLSLVGIE
ncbi:MAG: cobyric acid synthase [Deltaproteobacteria bacterium]